MVVVAMLAIIVIQLWCLLRPMKTWYVVEARRCDGDIANLVFVGDFYRDIRVGGRFKDHFRLSEFGPLMCYATIVHTNGEHVNGQVNVWQTVFTDFNAARCYFDSTKNDAPLTHYTTQKTYLWQVTARSRKTASVILPLIWPWNTRWFSEPKVEKITAFPETWLINDPETGMRQIGRYTAP